MSNEPRIEARPAQPTVGITRTVSMDTIGEIADRISDLFPWLAERGIDPCSAPLLRYHTIDMWRELVVEAAVAIAEPLPPGMEDGEVRGGEIPAGRYAVVVHHGHPDGLVQATGDLLAWGKSHNVVWDMREGDNGDEWASRLETYFTDPREQPDMFEWDTELAIKLAD